MEQAAHFEQECDALDDLLSTLQPEEWERATLFKGWTINDIVTHLFFWNQMAGWAMFDPKTFESTLDSTLAGIQKNGMRATEDEWIEERGAALHKAWRSHYRAVATRWAQADPKARVRWAGPDMSVRSSVTARQMETWSHAQAVFDLLGVERKETDRIHNIVVLGVNTFGWTFKARQTEAPGPMPHLTLIAPSGAVWTFGEPSETETITGQAVDFARVVTQTRNVADTTLQVVGPVATAWMTHAQCFAGPANEPPAPGSRHIQKKD